VTNLEYVNVGASYNTQGFCEIAKLNTLSIFIYALMQKTTIQSYKILMSK